MRLMMQHQRRAVMQKLIQSQGGGEGSGESGCRVSSIPLRNSSSAPVDKVISIVWCCGICLVS